MYDTETSALRGQQERNVQAWMRAAAYAAGTEPEDHFGTAEPDQAQVDEYFEATELGPAQFDLGEAVESKKRDNLALGEAMLSIGLIGRRELAEVRSAQTESDGLVGALLVASAIRSQLGEMLLKSKRITSSQLEFALEVQRYQGGLLGEILVGLGCLDRQTLDATLAAQAAGRVD